MAVVIRGEPERGGAGKRSKRVTAAVELICE
jgi:hypothetical protein